MIVISLWLIAVTLFGDSDLIGQICYHLFLDEERKDEEKKFDKKKRLNKYLDSSYEEIVRVISVEIADKYCSGCLVYNSPPFAHTCLLSAIDKIDMFGREALAIGIKSGTLYSKFNAKATKKFTQNEIVEFFNNVKEKKYKEVKDFFLLERI